MSKTTIEELAELGQSIWLDNINRVMIEDEKLKKLVDLGLRGMTSNPTIFDKAISKSSIYDKQISELCKSGKSNFEIYDELTVKDIQDAADIFRPVYEATQQLDGYISLEVNPKLAYRVKETIEEGKRLCEKVDRPNVMFKVPSTAEGFEAIEELTACGINVNMTLIFSLEQYINTAHAYIRGIKRFMQETGKVSNVRSVASVFISRIDTAVDSLLDEMIAGETDQKKMDKLAFLKGKGAVANSNLIYSKYLETFSSEEFKQLSDKGVNPQRVLWGSTSTKSPAYSDIKYVTELIGKGTINTVPGNTLEAFLDHGVVKEGLSSDTREAQSVINSLQEAGIDINDVCAELLRKGVDSFEKSFVSLLSSLEEKVRNRQSQN